MDNATIERLVDRIRKSLQQHASSGQAVQTINEIEASALALRDEVGAAIAEELGSKSLETQENGADSNKIECRCGRFARFKGLRSHTSITMAGAILFRRRYYYCRRCDAGFCPADAGLGINRGAYTDLVQQQVSRLCSLAPYNVAAGLFRDMCGVGVSVSHAQRMVEQADAVATTVLADRLQAAKEADELRLKVWAGDVDAPPRPIRSDQLYIEMDGVQTPLLHGWNEMKVGVCFRASPSGRHSKKTYVSHLGSAQDFAPQLYALSLEAGLETAKDVVILGDGARWIWNLAQEQFPQAIQILDIWHALDRLGNVARCAFGEENTARIAQWLQERKEELLASRLKAVEMALQVIARNNPDCRELVRVEIGYHKNNATRMDYAQYIQQGLSIGSGVAESACKRVVTQRLKGAGMRWAAAGAAAMARLRCFALSGQWDQIINRWNKPQISAYSCAT